MAIENVEYEIKVYDNYIEITPTAGMKDNSIYEVKLKGLKDVDGKKVLADTNVKLCTAMTPAYTTIESVNSLVDAFEIPDETILYHIREASKFIDYIKGTTTDEQSVTFEMNQYAKYKAAHECVLKYYITRASSVGVKGQLGDVIFDDQGKLTDISILLKKLKEEADYWIDAIRGYKDNGRAKPASAVKGGNIQSARQITDTPPTRSNWGG